MTMHPDTRAPIPHADRLAHHIETATHRVRIIEAAPERPRAARDDDDAGAMAAAAYAVIAACSVFAALAYVALRVTGIV